MKRNSTITYIFLAFLAIVSLIFIESYSGIFGGMTARFVDVLSNFGNEEIPEYDCYIFEAIVLNQIPDKKQLQYVSTIKPRVFGITTFYPNLEKINWLNELNTEELGYDFLKFYGTIDFSQLMLIKPHLTDIDIVGYCPLISFENITKRELSSRIDLLKETYPDKEILIGPCIDLFDKVIGSENKPDHLGFELFEKDFDNYIGGKYDYLIKNVLSRRTDVGIYLTVDKSVDLDNLRTVLNKAYSRNLTIGYMFDGNQRVFDFIVENQCK